MMCETILFLALLESHFLILLFPRASSNPCPKVSFWGLHLTQLLARLHELTLLWLQDVYNLQGVSDQPKGSVATSISPARHKLTTTKTCYHFSLLSLLLSLSPTKVNHASRKMNKLWLAHIHARMHACTQLQREDHLHELTMKCLLRKWLG